MTDINKGTKFTDDKGIQWQTLKPFGSKGEAWMCTSLQSRNQWFPIDEIEVFIANTK